MRDSKSKGICLRVEVRSLLSWKREERADVWLRETGEEHDHFYRCFIDWLEGTSVEEMKVKLGV